MLLVASNIAATPSFAQIDEAEDDTEISDSIINETPQADSPDVELTLDKNKKDKKTIIRSVRRSDSLQGILTTNGFTNDEVYNFLALPAWPKHYTLIPDTRYLISTYKSSKNVELIFFIPRSTQVLKLTKEEAGRTEMSISDFNFELRIRQVSGEINGSLFSSIRKIVPDPWVTMRFLDAYTLDYKLEKQVKRGAKFSIIYEEKLLNGQYVAPGEVLYTAIDIDGRKQERTFVKAQEGGVFIAMDADHDVRPFYSPIEYLHISSPFNMKRFHPIRRRRIPHRGTDFALNHGSSVLAALDGKVTRLGRNKASGIYVVLEHNNGYSTEYVHMSQLENSLRVGTAVKAGQKLGSVGCTGYCTRPHLHFGITKDGTHYDPIKLMKPYTVNQENKVKEFANCANKSSALNCSQKINE